MPSRVRAAAPRVATRDTRAVRPPAKTVNPLYTSPEWRRLVARLIGERGRRCEEVQCGRARDADGQPIRIFGDHIKELRDGGAPFDPANVLLRCGSCHTTKTARVRGARAAEVF